MLSDSLTVESSRNTLNDYFRGTKMILYAHRIKYIGDESVVEKSNVPNVARGSLDNIDVVEKYEVSSTSLSSGISENDSSKSNSGCKIHPNDFAPPISSTSSSDDSQYDLSFMATKAEMILWKDRTFND